ncbi:MAG: cation diffusion facilitator family transporter [Pseudomonadales bacterium]
MVHKHASPEISRDESPLGSAFLLISVFAVVEAFGGLFANSLTLLADAGHMLLDASALGLSWFAVRLSRRQHTETHSYGYHRSQVLAAFVNALLLVALCGWIVVEAVSRLESRLQMLPLPALLIATLGLVVNLAAFRMLHGTSGNLNVRSAALHVLGDLLGSCAAIAAAALVWLFEWYLADPILALVVVAILLRGAWKLLSESIHILLEGVPDDLDLDVIRNTLTAGVSGVLEVHHLHAWALTNERPMVTLHATVDEFTDEFAAVASIKAVLNESFGIDHSTIQVERGPCLDDS